MGTPGDMGTPDEVRAPEERGAVRVRAARLPDDLPRLAALYAEEAAWHVAQWPTDYRTSGDGVPSPAHRPSLDDQLLAAANDSSCCLLVAEVGREVVGLVGGQLHPKPTGGMMRHEGPLVYIGDLVVTAAYRRHGIGRLLMHRLEGWARQRGAASISLHVHDGNTAARALYTAEGFRAINVEMRKDLDEESAGCRPASGSNRSGRPAPPR